MGARIPPGLDRELPRTRSFTERAWSMGGRPVNRLGTSTYALQVGLHLCPTEGLLLKIARGIFLGGISASGGALDKVGRDSHRAPPQRAGSPGNRAPNAELNPNSSGPGSQGQTDDNWTKARLLDEVRGHPDYHGRGQPGCRSADLPGQMGKEGGLLRRNPLSPSQPGGGQSWLRLTAPLPTVGFPYTIPFPACPRGRAIGDGLGDGSPVPKPGRDRWLPSKK